MADASLISQLAELCNIQAHYVDAWGLGREVSLETKKRLLAAMDIDISSEQAVRQAVNVRQMRPWQRLLPPVAVYRLHQAPQIELSIPADAAGERFDAILTEESGEQQRFEFTPALLEEVSRLEDNGQSFVRYRLPLSINLSLGYHQLQVQSQSRAALNALVSVICVPEQCYQPQQLEGDGRLWGAAVQLYTLKSAKNWGIGDFSDLARLAADAGKAGVQILGLNPLHAMFPHNPHSYSPYSPSNRQFLNVLYIDVTAVPEFAESKVLQDWVAGAEFQAELAKVQAQELVDYPAVSQLKRYAFEQLFIVFKNHLSQNTARAQAFAAYCQVEGQALHRHGIYEALQEHFHQQDWSYWGWPVWPEEYRDPEGSAVARFIAAHTDRVQFFMYLQWLAAEQMAYAHQIAQAAGMTIGLYRDLAVGIDRAGSEAWSSQSLYTNQANIGAPPDALCVQGQDWGLPATVPDTLQETGYAAFISLIRANMKSCGALRLDHILGLFRLWWVPMPGSSTDGAYVYYPLRDLFGIMALESQRQRCMVVGEDLGTVPQEIRDAMQEMNILGYRIFFFERHPDGSFKRPEDYLPQTLATVSTHDLPTLVGYWSGKDIDVRDQLGLFPNQDIRNHQYHERDRDRHLIVDTLKAQQIDCGQLDYHNGHPSMSLDLRSAIQQYVARTASKLMLVQLEDLLGQMEQVNLPGTTQQQYPNWRRKLIADVEQIFNDASVQKLSDDLTSSRRIR